MTKARSAASPVDVTTPSDREIHITRSFDAPRKLIWDCYTKPELLQRWMGVMPGWSWAECRIDLRVGGDYRYLWRGPNGMQLGLRGKFVEVTPHHRLVTTEAYDEKWYDGGCTGTVILDEIAGRTTVTTLLRYDSKTIRDSVLQSPMKDGMTAGFNSLDALLSTLNR